MNELFNTESKKNKKEQNNFLQNQSASQQYFFMKHFTFTSLNAVAILYISRWDWLKLINNLLAEVA